MYPDPLVVQVGSRRLTVEDAGPPDGFPVLVHSGGGCRHLEPAAVRAARRHGLRLIGYDRPSYGGSTPSPGRSVADCAPDVRAIAGELGLGRLAVWGFSGGGPYALATAALLPEVVVAVCVLATIGPYDAPGLDWLDGMDDSYGEEVRLFFTDRAAARARFRVDAADAYRRLSLPQGWMETWGERAGTDDAHSLEAAEFLASGWRDGWTRGDEGWWDDWSAFLSPWGFALGDVAAPGSRWHGLADRRAPAAHGRWVAERLPQVTSHFPADEDHTNVEENNRAAGYAWIRAQVG
jgi:pimeloyl-ACP methyl ester carboxylesterase